MRRPNHASRFEGIAKTNLQASRVSDTESLQSQVNKAAKKRLSLSGLEILHGRQTYDREGAAKTATTTIPIVFVIAQDPVRLGLVASLARPGGNMTGISFLSGEVTAKRLELLRELVPAATRVAVLVDPANATYAEITVRETGAAARSVGLQIQVLKASTIG